MGGSSKFNISNNKYLKEFIIENPPWFKISPRCCEYAKKNVVHNCIKEGEYDLNIYGVRKFEGGARSHVYKNCFTSKSDSGKSFSEYRPLFFYTNLDKEEYENNFKVRHSSCYSEYGLDRTDCAGCPFGKDFEFELEVIKKYEPQLYVAVNNIFKDSYQYTKMFNEYRKQKKTVK